MTTVASPISVRAQATAIVTARLGSTASLKTPLEGIAAGVFVDLLLKLETALDIGLDVDELLPDGTVGDLVALAERRAAGAGRIYRWDDERARRALPLFAGRPAERIGAAAGGPAEAKARIPERIGAGAGGPAEAQATIPERIGTGAAGPAETQAKILPPRQPAPARIAVAVPSDAAWARAMTIQAGERTLRFALLLVAGGLIAAELARMFS